MVFSLNAKCYMPNAEFMKTRLKVLLIFNSPYRMPRGYDYKEEMSDPENLYTEKDVMQALRANGYQPSIIGIYDDLTPFLKRLKRTVPM